MIKGIVTFLSYIFLLFNSNLAAGENDKKLRVGLLAPFSGEYKNLGESLLLSTQLALDEINSENIIIIPRDSGSNDKEKLNFAIKEIINSGANVIIGPVTSSFSSELKKYNNTIFISLSNKEATISNNLINIGISLESQLKTIEQLLKNTKVFKYNSDPRILTGEIEKLTNYDQRKNNLKTRKNILKKNDDDKSRKELKILERLFTLGKVDFDSIIVIDFGNSLKSVLSSLIYTDVDDTTVLVSTVNQWFDESIFSENLVKNLYFPSVDMKQFKKYNQKYFKSFGVKPDEITILAYDALGLIHYIWRKNEGINSINDFFIKEKIKGKIGTFEFKERRVSQQLKIYKTDNNRFKEY